MTKTSRFILINTKTGKQQSAPLTRTWADRQAEQLNGILGAGVIVVAPAGWQGVGLN